MMTILSDTPRNFWRTWRLQLPDNRSIQAYQPSKILDRFPSMEPEADSLPEDDDLLPSTPGFYPASDSLYANLQETGWAAWFADGGKRASIFYANLKAQQQGQPGTLTTEDLRFALIHFDGLCPVSGCRLAKVRTVDSGEFWENGFSIDHRIPRAAGGATDAGNCLPMCAGCNQSKADLPALRWLIGKLGAGEAAQVYGKIEDYLRYAAAR